jgi:hypothetical protein
VIYGFAEVVIARAIRERVTLAAAGDGQRIRYQARGRPLSPDLRALLLEHKPAILAVLLSGGVKNFCLRPTPERTTDKKEQTLEVDGITVVVCTTYAEAEACIREMIADTGGKPVALDLETHAVQSERERLAALLEERKAVNAEAIAFRKPVRLNLRSMPIPRQLTPGSRPWTTKSIMLRALASILTDPRSAWSNFTEARRAPRSSTSLRRAQRP